MLARDVMRTKVVKISPDNSVRHAAEVMLANSISGLPVVDDDGRLVGIISEGDLIRRTELGSREIASIAKLDLPAEKRADAYVRRSSWRVGDVMTQNPVTVDESTPLRRIAQLMQESNIKRVPVTRSGELIGIVSRADLLQAVLTDKQDQTAAGDEAIQRSVTIRLGENTGLEELDIKVTVENGIVHLSGNVGTAECRKAARVVAEGVRGVKGVIEHFTFGT